MAYFDFHVIFIFKNIYNLICLLTTQFELQSAGEYVLHNLPGEKRKDFLLDLKLKISSLHQSYVNINDWINCAFSINYINN